MMIGDWSALTARRCISVCIGILTMAISLLVSFDAAGVERCSRQESFDVLVKKLADWTKAKGDQTFVEAATCLTYAKAVASAQQLKDTGLQYNEAFIDYHDGRYRLAIDRLSRLESVAIEEAEAAEGNSMRAAGNGSTSKAELDTLRKIADHAKGMVKDIQDLKQHAAVHFAQIRVTIAKDIRDEKGLVVQIAGATIDAKLWDGQASTYVEPGNCSVVVMTAMSSTNPSLIVRYAEFHRVSLRQVFNLTIEKLGPRPNVHPVGGYHELITYIKELENRVGGEYERLTREEPKNRVSACYNTASKELEDLRNNAATRLTAQLPDPAGPEDDVEVAKIRRIINYQVLPCLEDCKEGRTTCDPARDVPRVWPKRCCLCTLGSNDSPFSDSVGFAVSAIMAFAFMLRVRRGARRRFM